MAQTLSDLRSCPTRVDGAPVLFAHKVNPGQCQDRQRGMYHKCFSCAWNNAHVARHGTPRPELPESREHAPSNGAATNGAAANGAAAKGAAKNGAATNGAAALETSEPAHERVRA